MEIVEEDVLEKCWKAQPLSVYSNTATDTTHYSTKTTSPQKAPQPLIKKKNGRLLMRARLL
eukprot:1788900-Ditylum_brightwellii.AAC.1